jgi:hypothetical protein
MKGAVAKLQDFIVSAKAETMNILQALECLTTVMQQPLSMLIVA